MEKEFIERVQEGLFLKIHYPYETCRRRRRGFGFRLRWRRNPVKRKPITLILLIGMILALYAEDALNVPVLYPQILIVDSNRAIIPSLNCILELDLKTQKAKVLVQLRSDALAVPMAKDLEKAHFNDMVKITYYNRSTSDLYFEWSDMRAFNTFKYNLISEELEYLNIVKEDVLLLNQFHIREVYNKEKKTFESYFKADRKAAGSSRFDYAFPDDEYTLTDPFISKWQDRLILCGNNDLIVLAYKRGFRNPYFFGYLIGQKQEKNVTITDLLIELNPADGNPVSGFAEDVRDDMHYDPQISPPFFAQIQDGVFYFMTAWKVQEFHDPKVGTGDDPESQAYRLISVKQYDRESKEVKTVLTDVYDYTLPYSFYVYDGFIYYFKFNGFRKCATLYRKALGD